MRRLVTFLVLLSVVVGAAAVTPAPAGAASCATQGTMVLSAPLGNDPTSESSTVGFTLLLPCVNGGTASAAGSMSAASCNRAIGSGTVNGKPFNLQVAGSVMVWVHSASGVTAVFVVIEAQPGSCLNGTARRFLVTGVVSGI